MRSTKAITIKDVADKARVSIATVSRVLNNKPSVRPHIRKAVEDAISELNYEFRPSGAEQSNKATRIGLIVPDITNPYFPLLIKGISNIGKIQNAEIILCNSDRDLEMEKHHVQTLIENGAEGIIYIPFAEAIDSLLIDLVEGKFPIVFLDRELERNDICTVASDNEEGAYQATTYLLKLGHRNIVFISGPSFWSTSVTRFAGFRKGLDEIGIPLRNELILYGDATEQSASNEVQKLLDNEIEFSAVFASNDLMAFGAWKALEEAGLRVPDDVSVIGYDDIRFSEYISLSTIAQPSYEVGRNALMLLMDLIHQRREPPQRILLRDSLIIRKSCRRI